MAVQLLRRRFTVDEYYRMADAGILHEDDRVELIDGEIVEMAPIGSRHAACVNRLAHLFSEKVSGRAIVSVQNPIHLGEHSEPQPDITLLSPQSDFYAGSHPRAADALLIVEVADTSRDYDREVKLPLYARSGVREVWLVDLEEDRVEVHREPAAGGYGVVRGVSRGEQLSPQSLSDVSLEANEVLG